MNLPAALATGVGIAAYTVVDGLGVRASGNWIACTGGMFAFFLAVPLWSGAAPARGVCGTGCGSGQGGQRRADFARSPWRHHLGDTGKRDGRGVGVERNRRSIRRIARTVFFNERLTGMRIAICCVIAAGAACVGRRS